MSPRKRTPKPKVGRPALPEEERRAVISLRLAPDAIAMLDEQALACGETRSAYVERLIRRRDALT